MGVDSTLYQIIALGHILAAIVGFGGFIAQGAYNADAFRGKASDALAVVSATKRVTKLAMGGVYAVLAFGIALVPLSDDAIGFGEAWISASFVVWIAVVGITHAIVYKAVDALESAAQAAAPDAAMSEDPAASAAAKKLAMGEGLVQVLLAVALFLMIFQPGAG